MGSERFDEKGCIFTQIDINISLYRLENWMLTRPLTDLETFVDSLKAVAESSRMRILFLLSRGDLTVSDLTEILNQSQPRVSRHLKVLLDERLIGRYQEGSWAYFHLAEQTFERELVSGLISRIDSSNTPWVEGLVTIRAASAPASLASSSARMGPGGARQASASARARRRLSTPRARAPISTTSRYAAPPIRLGVRQRRRALAVTNGRPASLRALPTLRRRYAHHAHR